MNVEAERYLLGALLMDPTAYLTVSPLLSVGDFGIEKHNVLYRRMKDLADNSEPIDRVTVANELHKHGELNSIDGLSYLVSLDDGMPQLALYNLESYCHIVKEKAQLRLVIRRSQQSLDAAMSQAEPAAEIAASSAGRMIDIAKGTAADTGLTSLEDTVLHYGTEAMIDPSSRESGLATGFQRLDELTGGGLREGELIIVAARPSMGKTALALSIAQYVACHPRKRKAVAIFSLEMSRASLMQRMVCAHARVDHNRQRAGHVSPEERSRLEESLSLLAEAPIFIDDSAGMDAMAIKSNVRRLQQDKDVGLVIVDYLQLMQGGSRESRQQDVSNLSRSMKLMTKELRVPFLVLSQLSRAPDQRQGDHRPILSDLRESGAIEQDADMVAFVFREEVYRPDKESLKGIAELLIAKQRNGPIGKVKLAFIAQYAKFENLAFGDVGEPAMQEPPPWRPSGAGLFAVPDLDEGGLPQ